VNVIIGIWHWVVEYRRDLVIGLCVGIVIDLLSLRSRIGGLIGIIKNKQAEHSATATETRIKALEKQRDNMATFLTSDKALYLFTFRYLFLTLLFMSVGIGLLALNDTGALYDKSQPHVSPFLIFGIGLLAIAAVVAAAALEITALDTREKVTALVTKLNTQIAELQSALAIMRQKR